MYDNSCPLEGQGGSVSASPSDAQAVKQTLALYEAEQLAKDEHIQDLYEKIRHAEHQQERLEQIVESLRAKARELSEKGPYHDVETIADAALMFLNEHGSAMIGEIATGLRDGGFRTEAKDFNSAVRVALRRRMEKGECVQEGKLWRLPRPE